ncbi:DUF4169 family protein [Paracoccaceae bacterium]|nr:DUF4169 family protein [Paracoccaceae bacterium]
MSKIINLRRARKEKQRMRNRQQESENAIKFGQSKANKLLAATREARVREVLDQHRLSPDSEYDAE